MKIKLVLFDADGVLLDSLPQHLRICEDKNVEYGLGLSMPDVLDFKRWVRDGVEISPMVKFFEAVGFPKEFARRADEEYQATFMSLYAPAAFPGVHSTLVALHADGFSMGIVTSNTRENVVQALGQSINLFDPEALFFKEKKARAIGLAMTNLQVKPSETIYVGDQPADWKAAKEAGIGFLGVSYGWGISDEDQGFRVVSEVTAIREQILALAYER